MADYIHLKICPMENDGFSNSDPSTNSHSSANWDIRAQLYRERKHEHLKWYPGPGKHKINSSLGRREDSLSPVTPCNEQICISLISLECVLIVHGVDLSDQNIDTAGELLP